MIVSWSAGGALVAIEFDATMREQHDGVTTITEYHVERGVNPSDHARPENDRVTFDVLVTNTPIRVPNTHRRGVDGGFSQVDLETPAIINPPRILPGVGFAASLLNQVNQVTAVEVLNFDGVMDRIQDIHADLEFLRTSSTLVNLTTTVREYTDMVIRSVSLPRTPQDGSSATFTVTATSIRFVDSETVTVKADSAKKSNKGVKPGSEATPQQKESISHVLKDKGIAGVKKRFGL